MGNDVKNELCDENENIDISVTEDEHVELEVQLYAGGDETFVGENEKTFTIKTATILFTFVCQNNLCFYGMLHCIFGNL